MNPEITVLMSVFNGERYLRTAMSSILDQGFPEIEFLVIDDGSTDSTREVVLSFNDPRIRLLCNEDNIGLTASLNRGLREAKGEFIARMDADDISLPGRLTAQYAVLRDNLDVGVVSGWVQVIDAWGRDVEEWNEPLRSEDIFYRLLFSNCVTHGSVMFRKEIVRRLGGYDETLNRAQDYELWCRLSRKTKIHQLNQYVLKWRDHEGGISSKWRSEQDRTAEMIARPVLESLAGSELSSVEFDWLRSWDFERLDTLIDVLHLLRRINKGLLRTQAETITKIGLKKSLIKRAMREKMGQWLYLSLRPCSLGHLLHCFARLEYPTKFLLLREIISRGTRKVLR